MSEADRNFDQINSELSQLEDYILSMEEKLRELTDLTKDCTSKIYFLLDYMRDSGMVFPDGGFTFPDGDFWIVYEDEDV